MTGKGRILFVLLLLGAVEMACVIPASALRAGIGVKEITPPVGVKLWGYQGRDDPSLSVLDPLLAKAVVFDDGDTRAAVVSMDLGRTPPDAVLKKIRETLKERCGISQSLLAATHTHAGPSFGQSGVPEPWLEDMADRIVQAVEEASANLKSVTLAVASGTVDISYDRREVLADGTINMLWTNYDKKPTKPVDQTIRVLSIRDESGKALANLVHYACHPVIGGQKNLRITADFPAYLCRAVEAETEGTCVYLQGACGDINPYMAGKLSTEEGEDILKRDGEAVGKAVVKALENRTPVKEKELKIRFASSITPLGLRYPAEDKRIQDVLWGLYSREWVEDFLKADPPQFQAETSVLMLGRSIAWAGFPGEFFDEFQTDLLDRSPVPNSYFLGYCNGYLSYFPSIEAAAEGGYGASWGLMTEVGAGEKLVDRAVIDLYGMLDKFK